MNYSSSLLATVKAADQDFEWYPTDSKILEKVKQRINKFVKEDYNSRQTSLLDIGAGNGKVLDYFVEDFQNTFGIEKSSVLIETWRSRHLILGCDFYKTTLLDKNVDVIFCNPPYSEYESWAARIIKEASSNLIFLVIPSRWTNSQVIGEAIKGRECNIETVFQFDFNGAEDRVARAKVDVVEIRIKKYKEESPFSKFFSENFKYPEKAHKISLDEKIEETKLVKNTNLIETLDFLYRERMCELWNNYTAICSLDRELLEEFALTKESLLKSLELKINNCKKEFWQRLFDGMKAINTRLTKKSRQSIVRVMNDHTGIEFNRDNAYAVVIWVIKHCNEYFDEQFIETYEKLVSFANIESYKSNERVFRQDQFCYWNRYDRKTAEYYKLKTGNRIVLDRCGGLSNSSWDFQKGLTEHAEEFISDLLVIARNLNFLVEDRAIDRRSWDDSSAHNFYCDYKGKRLLFSVRAYKNGNMHFTLDTDFVHALNIMYGKLKGWISDKETAAAESNEEMSQYFDFDCRIGQNQLMLN